MCCCSCSVFTEDCCWYFICYDLDNLETVSMFNGLRNRVHIFVPRTFAWFFVRSVHCPWVSPVWWLSRTCNTFGFPHDVTDILFKAALSPTPSVTHSLTRKQHDIPWFFCGKYCEFINVSRIQLMFRNYLWILCMILISPNNTWSHQQFH